MPDLAVPVLLVAVLLLLAWVGMDRLAQALPGWWGRRAARSARYRAGEGWQERPWWLP